MTKFDAYQLAKYDRDGAVRLRDVLFLVHAKPKDAEQEEVWKQLVDGELAAPDTWEVALSAGSDKRETFERLIAEKKLGGLALLRNLRLMQTAEVSRDVIAGAIEAMRVDRILPYRFIAAARYAPDFEPELEAAMLKSIKDMRGSRAARGSSSTSPGSMDAALVRAVGYDAARGGLRPCDLGARGLRRGGDLHLLQRGGEGSRRAAASRCATRSWLAAAWRDLSRQGGRPRSTARATA